MSLRLDGVLHKPVLVGALQTLVLRIEQRRRCAQALA